MKKKIAIIGAGIAGLTLGNLLKKNTSFEFVIYEKEKFFNPEEGFGLQLSVNSVFILNQIGFQKLDEKEKYYPNKLNFYSIDCNKICDLNLASFNSNSEKYTTIKRSVLIKFLKDKLYTNSIIFGKKVIQVIDKNEKININFTDGSSDVVDYLIVSDGTFSNTKSIIEKNFPEPVFSEAFAIRSQVTSKDINEIDISNISLIMGAKAHLVLYPINKKKEINLVCIMRHKSKDIGSLKETLENILFKQNQNLANLFKGNLKSWPIYTSRKTVKSVLKNVLYMGDSFYTFLPTMAQGSSQAIESANEIFELINNNHPDLENEYFKNRSQRSKLINKRSKFNYFAFHLGNPILKNLRKFFLKRFIKNKKFISNYLGKIYK